MPENGCTGGVEVRTGTLHAPESFRPGYQSRMLSSRSGCSGRQKVRVIGPVSCSAVRLVTLIHDSRVQDPWSEVITSSVPYI